MHKHQRIACAWRQNFGFHCASNALFALVHHSLVSNTLLRGTDAPIVLLTPLRLRTSGWLSHSLSSNCVYTAAPTT
eukprot:43181-Prorocentrum_lima.AAC.1